MTAPKPSLLERAVEFYSSNPPIVGDGKTSCLYCPKTKLKARGLCRMHYEMILLYSPDRVVKRTDYPSDSELISMARTLPSIRQIAEVLGIKRESLRDYLSIRPELMEAVKEASGKCKDNNKVGIRESRKRWVLKNPDKVREMNRRWAKNQSPENRARWNNYNRERRMRNKEAALQDEEDLYYSRLILNDPCSYCLTKESPSLDHIVPILHGGNSRWENLTGSCRSCNSSKNSTSLVIFLLRNRARTDFSKGESK